MLITRCICAHHEVHLRSSRGASARERVCARGCVVRARRARARACTCVRACVHVRACVRACGGAGVVVVVVVVVVGKAGRGGWLMLRTSGR